MIDDRLLGVKKPARYIGKEWNVSEKMLDSARLKVCLCFPEMYEVGMSNLGIRILYSILNGIEGVACERAFAPDADMEKFLRENKLALFSLESQRPLADFDLLGFGVGYELSFTNILAMLDLAGLPLLSSQRDRSHPLVIAGGTSVFNPEPIADFIDAFFIGEAEEACAEIVEVILRHKGDSGKEKLLEELARIEGVYVPSLPGKVKKRVVCDLEKAHFPRKWLVPYIQVVHDRVTVEIMRGCPNRCRFCQARSQYFPLRVRKPGTVRQLCEELYRNTGYEEITLTGLSVSDYPYLKEVAGPLLQELKKEGASLSLPSMKPKSFLGELSTLIAAVKKTGLTFAPEAGNAKMREVLGKDFNEDDFFATLEQAYQSGYQHVKLYFMIGLPHETQQDLDDIIDLTRRVSELRRKIKGRPAQVNVSVNTVIPKAHTPFQWLAMAGLEEMRSKQEYIRDKARNRNFRFTFHNRFMSLLEGVFSRGDRQLSRVILAAFNKGARSDGWDEYFRFELWQEAFKECGIDPESYLRQRDTNEVLPWDFIDTGVPRDELLREYLAIK